MTLAVTSRLRAVAESDVDLSAERCNSASPWPRGSAWSNCCQDRRQGYGLTPPAAELRCLRQQLYDTIRYGRLKCAQKLTRWPAYNLAHGADCDRLWQTTQWRWCAKPPEFGFCSRRDQHQPAMSSMQCCKRTAMDWTAPVTAKQRDLYVCVSSA